MATLLRCGDTEAGDAVGGCPSCTGAPSTGGEGESHGTESPCRAAAIESERRRSASGYVGLEEALPCPFAAGWATRSTGVLSWIRSPVAASSRTCQPPARQP